MMLINVPSLMVISMTMPPVFTMQSTFPNGAQQWLYEMPPNTAIGQVPAPYCPGCRHGHCRQCEKKHNTQLTFHLALLYFFTSCLQEVRNTKLILYSAH
jgi:hypothetical protein